MEIISKSYLSTYSINARINLFLSNGKTKNIHISEFKDLCKCVLNKEYKSKNGANVTDYNVLDEVYINAIDINTGQIEKKRVTNWSIHENLRMWDIKKRNRNSLIPSIGEFKVSEDHSLIVLDMEEETIKRTNIKDVIENQNKYAFIRSLDSTYRKKEINNVVYLTYIPKSLFKQSKNLVLTNDEKTAIRKNGFTQSRIVITDEDVEKIQNESIRNIVELQNEQKIQILPCRYFDYNYDPDTTTAYDLTVEDFQTFSTDDGIFVYDTVALFPLFSKKANDEAREKMNPITSSTMWNDPARSGKVLYDLKLDATAIIYTATKR